MRLCMTYIDHPSQIPEPYHQPSLSRVENGILHELIGPMRKMGKKAIVAVLLRGSFFGEGCLVLRVQAAGAGAQRFIPANAEPEEMSAIDKVYRARIVSNFEQSLPQFGSI